VQLFTGSVQQAHDRRTIDLFIRCFGSDKLVKRLNKRDWDKFVRERRAGTLRPKGVKKARAIGEQQIRYDLQFLLAVLNWATLVNDDRDYPLLVSNPLKGYTLPKEENPRRVTISHERYVAMIRVSETVSPLCTLALVLAHETGHRISSLSMSRWSDINFEKGTIRWRAENDKIGFEHEPPASKDALQALQRARRTASAIGDSWVFPAARDATKPCSRSTFTKWWRHAERLAKLDRVKGLCWHSFRRKFATELKAMPLKDLSYSGGWKSPQTLLNIYQRPDEETMREGLANRKTLRVVGAI
jgi:integrase